MNEILETVVKGLHDQHFAGGGDGSETSLLLDLQKAMLDGGMWQAVRNILDAKKKMPLKKALATTTFGAYQGIEPLRIEDLSSILTRQVYDAETVPLYKRVKKVKVHNIFTQYNRLLEYASYDNAFPFAQEGALPKADDSRYRRMNATVRFAGTLRAVTDPAVRVTTAGSGITNLKSQENENGMTFLLQQLEQTLIFQQASCSFVGGTQLGYDGLIPQFLDALSGDAWMRPLDIDMHNTPLGPSNFRQAALRLRQIGKHSFPKDKNGILNNMMLMCDPYNADQVVEQMSPLARFTPGGQIIPGGYTNVIQTQFGKLPMIDNVWISNYRRIGEVAPAVAAGREPPDAPPNVTIANPGATVNSNWNASDASANVFYFVSSVGPNGESAAVASAPVSIAVNQGESVTITVTNPIVNQPMAYNVWRGTSADNAQLVWQFPIAAGPSTVISDLNYWMPGTTPAFALVYDPDVLDIAELTPFFSMALGIIDMSYRWVIMTYLVPRLRNPYKFVLYRNCMSSLAL